MYFKYFYYPLFLLFSSLTSLYCDHPIILLIAHSRSCSTVIERCMHEREDIITMHEPFSYLYFQMRDGKDHETLKLFKGKYYSNTYEDLIININTLSKSSPVFIKDLGIGCKTLFNDQCFLKKENLFFIFLVRHPSTTLLSLFKLDPKYPDAHNEYSALYRCFEDVPDTRKKMILSAELFCEKPEEYLQQIATWAGLKKIEGTSQFKKEPPESWANHTHWCKTAISSNSIESLNRGHFQTCPTFTDSKELSDIWTKAYKDSIFYYEKFINHLE